MFLDNFLFIGLPYIAIIIFIVGTVYRYRATKFNYSSLSSQFLEGKKLFWGSVPFHWGIIALFFGHLIAFLIPRGVLAWNSHPLRLLVIEVGAFIFGLTVLFGLSMLIYRRLTNQRLSRVTSPMDWTVEGLLLLQVILGLWVAYEFRWGSSWFAATLTPYLRSLFILQPEITAVSAMPLVVKLHIAFAFVIFAMIPFSRLVHVLVYPLHYLWRPYQRVLWNWDKSRIRHPDTQWTKESPRNT
ncbi:MAG: respiratory nitrate reductase subunit gamma [Ignavibacteriae bacterium]|nr:respiratory nitrate reductase subunit gamma [Ignavibacteriota bacterium]MCB9215764.1 respiratory nitrate reductase subunit gamma [Ignavibacteria bacterium]